MKLLDNHERLLSTILIGNNLANIAASALNTAIAIQLAPILGIPVEWSVTLFAVLLTLVILLFGEITPKTIALVHNRRIALSTAPLLVALGGFFLPVSFFFDKISKFLNRIVVGTEGKVNRITESTVINVVSKGEELGVINKKEQTLIQNVFLFDEREVYPIMTPRTSVFALEEGQTLADVQEAVMERQFSRIPIYKDTIDNITGVVHLKTMFRELLSDRKDVPLRELAKKTIFIYETLSLTSLLEQFQAEQNHMAIVVDEFGGMAGVVTLEDILEELVGEIFDEKDIATIPIRKLTGESWMIAGSADIQSINKEISGEFIADGEYETLQGLIMSHLERIPVVGDSFHLEAYHFTVMQMNKHTVTSAKVVYTPPKNNEED